MSRKRKTAETKDSLDEQIEKKRRIVQEAKTRLQESEADLAKLEDKKQSESKKTALEQAKGKLAAERIRVLKLDERLERAKDDECASQFYRTIKEHIESFVANRIKGHNDSVRYDWDVDGGPHGHVAVDLEMPMEASFHPNDRREDTAIHIDLHEFYFNDGTGFGYKHIVEDLDESLWLAVLVAHDHIHGNNIDFYSVTLSEVCDDDAMAKKFENEDSY